MNSANICYNNTINKIVITSTNASKLNTPIATTCDILNIPERLFFTNP